MVKTKVKQKYCSIFLKKDTYQKITRYKYDNDFKSMDKSINNLLDNVKSKTKKVGNKP